MEGRALFFNRSGDVQSPGLATSFWLGDQLVTWDEFDGMKTAVTGLLSSGISGYSINHSDIGGYTTSGIAELPGVGIFRTKELLLRWMEMNAFTAIFRTHEGNVPEINTQFYSDGDTYAHFSRFAKVYRALGPYREALFAESSGKGYPLVRHPFLHYPEDPEVSGLMYQFMLGSDFMVAPVLDPGAEQVEIFLPAGEWTHLWSGEQVSAAAGGRWLTFPAPMGEPAVFFRNGSRWGAELVNALVEEGIL